MPKNRTAYQVAAGRLISAIQKEWHIEAGETTAHVTETVMDAAHLLLLAKSPEAARELLGARSLKQYLGETWVRRHRAVRGALEQLEIQLAVGDS